MQIKINGKDIEAGAGETILEAALKNGIDIPNLCYDSDLEPNGSCRMCVCEVNGRMMTACNTKVMENMVVETETERICDARKLNIELLLSSCRADKNDKLIEFGRKYGAESKKFDGGSVGVKKIDESSPSLIRDSSKCILCGRCVKKCRITQEVNAICFEGRGVDLKVGTAFNHGLGDTVCVNCGQCVLTCPTGALREVDDIDRVRAVIKDSSKHVIVQTAPAIRASIGEEFGMPAGTLITKKLVGALRKLGFDKVFDTDFAADLTIVEEASELIERITKKGVFPQFTSCCPAWVKFVEEFYPDFIPNLSSCKSPHQMLGAVIKTYYAKKVGVDAKNIIVVSIMPCTAKKFECVRPEMNSSGYMDVDFVLTTREAARFMKEEGIDISKMDDDKFDNPLGESTGAGVIFGATGGVMEAALRTAYEYVTGNSVTDLEFNQIRGLPGIKEGKIVMNGATYHFAVAHGLANARVVMEQMKRGKCKYQFIEIMACPGGCIGGGGQPIPTNDEIRAKRIEAIYKEDRNLPLRKSHENPSIIKLYKEFQGKPLGKMSHKLLHTKYVKRDI